MIVLGVDPGRQKTGLAMVDGDGAILWRAIVPSESLGEQLDKLLNDWRIERIALGHSTGSELAASRIKAVLKERNSAAKLEIVNERDSTLEARPLYFAAHPPQGWRRLLPISLQSPPVPVDDFAAAVLARRLFQAEERRSGGAEEQG